MDLAGHRILVACALKRECSVLRRELIVSPSAGPKPAPRLDFLVTGIGVVRTEQSLYRYLSDNRSDICLVIFTGTAGQLDPSLRMGETVCPQSWALTTGEEFEVGVPVIDELRARGIEVAGRGLTVTRPVLRASARAGHFRETGARICDMEAAGALRIAAVCGVPCMAPKVVSDTADSSALAFWTHFEPNMIRLGEYLKQLLAALGDSQP